MTFSIFSVNYTHKFRFLVTEMTKIETFLEISFSLLFH